MLQASSVLPHSKKVIKNILQRRKSRNFNGRKPENIPSVFQVPKGRASAPFRGCAPAGQIHVGSGAGSGSGCLQARSRPDPASSGSYPDLPTVASDASDSPGALSAMCPRLQTGSRVQSQPESRCLPARAHVPVNRMSFPIRRYKNGRRLVRQPSPPPPPSRPVPSLEKVDNGKQIGVPCGPADQRQ